MQGFFRFRLFQLIGDLFFNDQILVDMRVLNIRLLLKFSASLLAMIFLLTPEGIGQNQTIAGEVTSPYPTLLNLAFEWQIRGDDNQNGVVEVHYRKKGDTQWLQGMSLRRVPARENEKFKWPNKHSGSIFDLAPGSQYEIKLSLTDPDGGSAERTMVVSTRPEPRVPAGAEIVELTPGAFDTLKTKSGTHDRPVVYQCSKGIAIYKYIDLRNKQWVF